MSESCALLLQSLESFYKKADNMANLQYILNNKDISLRIIDWFVSNYSKKFASQYIIYKNSDNEYSIQNSKNSEIYKQVNIYHSYKCQLKSFSKKYFDPFCRRNRIKFYGLNTTIGQLNFFKWAIDILLIDYIYLNYKYIEDDMNTSYNTIKNTSKVRKKRQELSISASRGLTKYTSKIKIHFD